MGTNLEPIPEPTATEAEPIAWIGRERTGIERLAEPQPVPVPAMTPAGSRSRARLVWTLGALAVLLLVVLVAWKLFGGAGKSAQSTLADRGAVPLISVIVPALQPVTSSVSFTGAIAARYDMPIANEGDTGRIVAVYVEAGDHVKRGQILAKIDDSVLIQQANRLAASLEQAQAQAALSAAEYKRALGVEAAGALSAEDIEKRRATAVTDAANVKVVAAQLAEAKARLERTRIGARLRARCSRATPRWDRSPPRAARHCFASPAAVKSRCAARSPSRISRRSRSVRRDRIPDGITRPFRARCVSSGP